MLFRVIYNAQLSTARIGPNHCKIPHSTQELRKRGKKKKEEKRAGIEKTKSNKRSDGQTYVTGTLRLFSPFLDICSSKKKGEDERKIKNKKKVSRNFFVFKIKMTKKLLTCS